MSQLERAQQHAAWANQEDLRGSQSEMGEREREIERVRETKRERDSAKERHRQVEIGRERERERYRFLIHKKTILLLCTGRNLKQNAHTTLSQSIQHLH